MAVVCLDRLLFISYIICTITITNFPLNLHSYIIPHDYDLSKTNPSMVCRCCCTDSAAGAPQAGDRQSAGGGEAAHTQGPAGQETRRDQTPGRD